MRPLRYLTFMAAAFPVAAMSFELPDLIVSDALASFEAGIICAVVPDEIVAAPDTVAGTKSLVAEPPPFVSHDRRVPAVLGVGFGASSLAANPEGIHGVTMFTSHPPFPGSGATSQSFATSIPGTEPGISFYQFDYEYELVLGLWTLTSVDAEGEVIFSVSFEVVPPEEVPDLAEACNFVELLG